jgi:hypothetical protein
VGAPVSSVRRVVSDEMAVGARSAQGARTTRALVLDRQVWDCLKGMCPRLAGRNANRAAAVMSLTVAARAETPREHGLDSRACSGTPSLK